MSPVSIRSAIRSLRLAAVFRGESSLSSSGLLLVPAYSFSACPSGRR